MMEVAVFASQKVRNCSAGEPAHLYTHYAPTHHRSENRLYALVLATLSLRINWICGPTAYQVKIASNFAEFLLDLSLIPKELRQAFLTVSDLIQS
jgi:hypothetical protein